MISVIAYHDRLRRFGRLSDALLHHFGFLGVFLFFAISGLLICSRLLDEERAVDRIHVKSFYVRRAFRILPAALLYLAVVGALGSFHIIRVDLKAWLASLFFFNNYYSAAARDVTLSLPTNHFWTLSVEEHFYLVLPFILVFFKKQRVLVLGALSALFMTYTIVEQSVPALYRSTGGEYGDVRTEVVIVSLFFPAFLAVLLANTSFRLWCERWVTPLFAFVGFAVLWVILHFSLHVLALKALVPLGFPFLILSTVLHPGSFLGRALEVRPIRFLGRISYSLYLWQQIFFIGEHEPAAGMLSVLQQWPISIGATLICALGSYYLVETPLIRIGHRFAPPATAGRPVSREQETLSMPG